MATNVLTWPVGLTKRSEVLILADRTGVTPREAAAAWMEFLEWVSCQESAPVLPSISLATIDRLTGLSGFAAVLGQQKWLAQRSDGIHILQWDEVWSPEVTARKADTERKRKARRQSAAPQTGQMSGQSADKCPDNPPHTPPVCFGLLSPIEEKAVQTAWEVFENHRIQKDKKAWTQHAREINIKKTAFVARTRGYKAAVAMLERSVEGGWTRLVVPDNVTEHDLISTTQAAAQASASADRRAWWDAMTHEQQQALKAEYYGTTTRKQQDEPGFWHRWCDERRVR